MENSDAIYTKIAAGCVLAFALIVVFVSILPNLGHLSVPALMNKPVSVSSDNFPDPAFREYVSTYIDTDADGYLSESEIVAVRAIGAYDHNSYNVTDPGVSDSGITTLRGIENFYKLESLVAADNQITDLDISGNPALRYIDMRGNESFSIGYSKANSGAQLLVGDDFKSSGDVSELDIVKAS